MEITNTNNHIQLDFEQAKAKHLLFKSKLRSILYGEQLTDEAPVLSHYECAVGKWIYEHALKDFGHIPEMQQLEKVHADIHTSARELVTLYKEGKVEKAREGLTGMEKIADHLIELLTTVENKIAIEHSKNKTSEEELSANRKELNELLKANQELDKKIQEQSGELIHERQLLHNFFMQAPAAFSILKGPQHIFELANEGYLRLAGKKDLIGKSVREALPELEGQGFFELLDKVFITGEPFIGTEMPANIDKDGNGKLEQVYLNFIYQAFKNTKGITEGILVFAYEVTDQVIARKKTEESEHLFHTLANTISHLAWMANADGWIYWYNERWYNYTGTTLEEMQGWGWEKVHHPDHIEKVVSDVKKLWNTAEPFEMTFPLKSKEGKYRWFLARAYPIKNQEGKVIQWIGTNTDIDDQKKALEQKDEFISIASHELKTPVTSLKAFTQILQMKFEKEENHNAVDLLSRMDKQVDKLTKLIVDLLDATKIENGQLRLTLEDFDFNDLINEIVEEMQRTTITHTIKVQLTETKIINGDKNRIGQVIINLISNAIKYSPDSDHINVSTKVLDQEIKLCVQDFGIGIAAQKQPKIFDRFFRVTSGGQETFPGLGLGLFISKEIVTRHNGSIYLTSIEGNGATFCFTLPAKELRK